MGERITLILAGGELTQTYSDGHHYAHPGVSCEEIASWLPDDLKEDLDIVDWTRQPSGHFTLRLTSDLIELAAQQVQNGARGVVLATGSDGLEEMAYLASLTWSYPQPLVFAAGKRPDGVLGSDARATLVEALRAAASSEAWGCGALVCCQGELFDAEDLNEDSNCGRVGLVTSPRGPIGEVLDDKVFIWHKKTPHVTLSPTVKPARHVELIYASLGGGEWQMEALASKADQLDGLVIAGFGGGNVHPTWVTHIKKLLREEVPVVIVSRCPNGRITTYSTSEGCFSKLADLGAINGGDLTPRRARIKLASALGAELSGSELETFLKS